MANYGDIIDSPLVGSDLNTKYVGFSDYSPGIKDFFSQKTINIISKKVTELLMGVDPNNRPIIVPDDKIAYVMQSIYQNFTPSRAGDLYTRYTIPSGSNDLNYVSQLINQVIAVIYTDVKTNLEMEANNKKLTIWTTVLGDFNTEGLRSHPVIYTQKRRPDPMTFNMNY